MQTSMLIIFAVFTSVLPILLCLLLLSHIESGECRTAASNYQFVVKARKVSCDKCAFTTSQLSTLLHLINEYSSQGLQTEICLSFTAHIPSHFLQSFFTRCMKASKNNAACSCMLTYGCLQGLRSD